MSQQPWGAPQYGAPGYGQQNPQFQQPPQQQGWGQPQTNGWGNPPQQQRPQQPTRSANDVLMGGGGAPSWNFPEPGVRKVAKIVKPPTTRQETEYDQRNPHTPGKPKFFPSGDPIMMVMVEVQTDERDYATDQEDDGRRTFYIQGRRLRDAVRDAVRAGGADGLEVGGILDVALDSYDVPGDRKSGRNWTITYTSAANASLGGGMQIQQVAPPQQAYGQPVQQHQQGFDASRLQPTSANYPQQQWSDVPRTYDAPYNPPQTYPTNPTEVQGPPPGWAQQPMDVDQSLTGGPSQQGFTPEQQAAWDAMGGGQ